jgi:hypothetical protein
MSRFSRFDVPRPTKMPGRTDVRKTLCAAPDSGKDLGGACTLVAPSMNPDRRRFLLSASILVAGAVGTARASAPGPMRALKPMVPAQPIAPLTTPTPPALERHPQIVNRHRMALVDFAAPSSEPRLHIVNLLDGTTTSYLVAHGSGSDPDHSGWLERFSNAPGSNASCSGAFLTADPYVGKHGPSQRLQGLDPTNDNAMSRAIVLHGAWYAEPTLAGARGKLGRSQGCFAVGDSVRSQVMAQLGRGSLIYAAKLVV